MGGDGSWIGTPTTAISRAGSEAVAFGTTHDLTRVGQCGEALVQGAVTDTTQRTQFRDRQRTVRVRDRGGDTLVDGRRRGRRRRDRLDDFQGQGVAALRKLKDDRAVFSAGFRYLGYGSPPTHKYRNTETRHQRYVSSSPVLGEAECR
jgi:hypothetical protein